MQSASRLQKQLNWGHGVLELNSGQKVPAHSPPCRPAALLFLLLTPVCHLIKVAWSVGIGKSTVAMAMVGACWWLLVICSLLNSETR